MKKNVLSEKVPRVSRTVGLLSQRSPSFGCLAELTRRERKHATTGSATRQTPTGREHARTTIAPLMDSVKKKCHANKRTVLGAAKAFPPQPLPSLICLWHCFVIFFSLCVGLAAVVVLRASFECSCAFVANETRVSAFCIVFLDDVVSLLLACIWCCLSFFLCFWPHFLARISSSAVLGARSEAHSKESWTRRYFFFSRCDSTGQSRFQSHYKWHGTN